MTKDLMSLFNEFMFECKYARKLKPATLKSYNNVIGLFNKFFPGIYPEEVSSTMIVSFFEKLETRERVIGRGHIRTGIKISTVATYRSKLNPFFEWLKMRGHIRENPCKAIKYQTPSYDERKYLNKAKVEKILAAVITNADNNAFLLKRNLLIFYLFLYCGLRKNEVLNIHIRDIDFSKRELTVRAETSKSRSSRIIPLHPQVMMSFKDYFLERKNSDCEYLLISKATRNKYTSEGLNHLVRKLRIKSGIKFHVHQLRHTFAVNFLAQNNNIVKLKQLLGHKNISMTMVYVRCLPTKYLTPDIAKMDITSFL